jgi:hypothetical protein
MAWATNESGFNITLRSLYPRLNNLQGPLVWIDPIGSQDIGEKIKIAIPGGSQMEK